MCNLFMPFNLHKCSYIPLIVFRPLRSAVFALSRTTCVVWSMVVAVAATTVIDVKIEFHFKNKLCWNGSHLHWMGCALVWEDLCLFMRQQQTTRTPANEEQWRICENRFSTKFCNSVFCILLSMGCWASWTQFPNSMPIVHFGHFSFSFFEIEYAPRLVIIAHHGTP